MVRNPFQLQKRLKNCSKIWIFSKFSIDPKNVLDNLHCGGHYNIKIMQILQKYRFFYYWKASYKMHLIISRWIVCFAFLFLLELLIHQYHHNQVQYCRVAWQYWVKWVSVMEGKLQTQTCLGVHRWFIWSQTKQEYCFKSCEYKIFCDVYYLYKILLLKHK